MTEFFDVLSKVANGGAVLGTKADKTQNDAELRSYIYISYPQLSSLNFLSRQIVYQTIKITKVKMDKVCYTKAINLKMMDKTMYLLKTIYAQNIEIIGTMGCEIPSQAISNMW